MPAEPRDAFVSYNRADRPWAERVLGWSFFSQGTDSDGASTEGIGEG